MFNLQRSAASVFKVAAFAVIAALASLLITSSLQAQDAGDSVSIAVSPQSLDTAINPGQSTENVFRISNGGDQPITVEPTPKNFVPRGNEGAVSIEDEDTPYSLAKWLSVKPAGQVTIESKQTADFTVTISVPKNADPGGHFGSVVFRTVPRAQEGSNATVSQEVAPVILVRVPGNAKEEAVIASFGTPAKLITSSSDITFESIIANNGNVHLKPTGTVAVFNVLGKQVASTQVDSQNVIPGAERKMNSIWEKPGFRFGLYKSRLTMVYGNENKIMTAEASFFILPVKQVLPAVLILVILAFILFRIRRRLVLAFKVLTDKHEGR